MSDGQPSCGVIADKSSTQLPGNVRTHSTGWIPDPAARAGSIAVSAPPQAGPVAGGGRFRSVSDHSLGVGYDAASSVSVVGIKP